MEETENSRRTRLKRAQSIQLELRIKGYSQRKVAQSFEPPLSETWVSQVVNGLAENEAVMAKITEIIGYNPWKPEEAKEG